MWGHEQQLPPDESHKDLWQLRCNLAQAQHSTDWHSALPKEAPRPGISSFWMISTWKHWIQVLPSRLGAKVDRTSPRKITLANVGRHEVSDDMSGLHHYQFRNDRGSSRPTVQASSFSASTGTLGRLRVYQDRPSSILCAGHPGTLRVSTHVTELHPIGAAGSSSVGPPPNSSSEPKDLSLGSSVFLAPGSMRRTL